MVVVMVVAMVEVMGVAMKEIVMVVGMVEIALLVVVE